MTASFRLHGPFHSSNSVGFCLIFVFFSILYHFPSTFARVCPTVSIVKPKTAYNFLQQLLSFLSTLMSMMLRKQSYFAQCTQYGIPYFIPYSQSNRGKSDVAPGELLRLDALLASPSPGRLWATAAFRKTKIHDASQRRHRSVGPRPRATCTEQLMSGCMVREICEWTARLKDIQTYRRDSRNTPPPTEARLANISLSAPIVFSAGYTM